MAGNIKLTIENNGNIDVTKEDDSIYGVKIVNYNENTMSVVATNKQGEAFNLVPTVVGNDVTYALQSDFKAGDKAEILIDTNNESVVATAVYPESNQEFIDASSVLTLNT